MEVFVSWSGDRSHKLAGLLRDWLPQVIQQLRPWISTEDIRKGQRWAAEIGSKLNQGSQGVICLTPDSLGSPWLNFEAGALAKSLETGRVRPLLLDMRPSDIVGPLEQFQATVVRNKEDMYKLVASLNSVCNSPLAEAILQKAFDRAWPDFAGGLESIPSAESDHPTTHRDTNDVLAELLERVRDVQRTVSLPGLAKLVPTFKPSVGDVQGLWGMVLSEVRRKSQRAWAVIREGIIVAVMDDPLVIDGHTLILAFRHSVHANLLAGSPGMSDLITTRLESLLGGRWWLETVSTSQLTEARGSDGSLRPLGRVRDNPSAGIQAPSPSHLASQTAGSVAASTDPA